MRISAVNALLFGQHAELLFLRKGESRKAEVLQRLRRIAERLD
jgi:hypothetical protein